MTEPVRSLTVTGPGRVERDERGHLVFYPDDADDFLPTMLANRTNAACCCAAHTEGLPLKVCGSCPVHHG